MQLCFWFRGHADCTWKLTPTALRPHREGKRDAALQLLHEFRRHAPTALQNPPAANDDFSWVQLAQHNGLATRVLDWTMGSLVALYFACLRADRDGAVFVVNPVDLNRMVDAGGRPRIFDAVHDADLISKYFTLGPTRSCTGPLTIAVNPALSFERIKAQQGTFTVHGSRCFSLGLEQASSLLCVPVPRHVKAKLMGSLESTGVHEMFLFPEPPSICRHLMRSANIRGRGS